MNPDPAKKDDRISSTSQLAQFATDLTDYEVKQVGEIVGALVMKYGKRANSADNLEALRDEALTKFADIGILATFDPTPCFYGEPPTVEIIGKVEGDDIHKYGFDHELKKFEVQAANKRGEDYYGQKEEADGKRAARDRREKMRKLPNNKAN